MELNRPNLTLSSIDIIWKQKMQWIGHVSGMELDRLPESVLHCHADWIKS